jgi:hypothetical protein
VNRFGNKRTFFLCLILGFSLNRANAQDNSVIGKVICGYQGWFNCYGDGSPVERWVHWSGGKYKTNEGLPSPGYLSFEMYPDVNDYAPSSLFQTGFANCGDGNSSVLFSSTQKDVMNKHFSWMKQYGIDGVALQRFLTTDNVFVMQKDTIALNMRMMAEKYQRIFYLMYDMKASDSTVFKNDLQHVETFNLSSSPYYAHQNGKPVICIWGFGLTSRPDLPNASLRLVQWLKGKGYYVIGGVPTNWRTGTSDSWADYIAVYNAFDMISPWTVGRGSVVNNTYQSIYLQPDYAYCQAHGIEYQPVIFAGFAWSNWNGGSRNQIPRNKGELMWQQLYNIKNSGIKNMYVAMFDEYDESTAIAKAADSYFDIPTNQYFLTTSADGTYLSSDFYLRLVGKATRVLKGLDPLTANVTIPYSEGPVYFRTSVESGYDALPNWQSETQSIKNVLGFGGFSTPQCNLVPNERRHSGNYSIKFSGRDNSATESYCDFKVFDVDIPVLSDTKLAFWSCPVNDLGRYVSIDFLFTDGTRLKELNAKDMNGLPINPSQGHGEVNAWTKTICNVGQWAKGKTIDRILICYDHPADTGDFSGYIDDIFIYTQDTFTSVQPIESISQEKLKIYPNPVFGGKMYIDLSGFSNEPELTISLTDIRGRILLMKGVYSTPRFELPVSNLNSGIYLVTAKTKRRTITAKIIIQ